MGRFKPLCGVVLWLLAPLVFAEEALVLVDGERRVTIPMAALQDSGDQRFSFHAPFRGAQVEVQGHRLADVLQQYLGRTPERLQLVASNDYTVQFEQWDPDNWILVTHENGEPLSVRNHGPLRLVERDYGERDPGNLRNFTDWIWMLNRIEVLE